MFVKPDGFVGGEWAPKDRKKIRDMTNGTFEDFIWMVCRLNEI